MESISKASWVKAKASGEFVARIVVIVALVYGLSWVVDDILAHAHVHIDNHWWAYRMWHAWWWLIVPLCLAGIGWRHRQQTLGGGTWAVGTIWVVFIGYAVGMMLFL
jgi:hypothetical protein